MIQTIPDGILITYKSIPIYCNKNLLDMLLISNDYSHSDLLDIELTENFRQEIICKLSDIRNKQLDLSILNLLI